LAAAFDKRPPQESSHMRACSAHETHMRRWHQAGSMLLGIDWTCTCIFMRPITMPVRQEGRWTVSSLLVSALRTWGAQAPCQA
jgi:hypothetical protein